MNKKLEENSGNTINTESVRSHKSKDSEGIKEESKKSKESD
jgi:hypothetical protein